MTNNTDLFTKYINSDVAAEQAAYNLREAIVTIVISNTSKKIRVDEDFYNLLIKEAEIFVRKETIKFYKNDCLLTEYTFTGSQQQILNELQRFFSEVIIGYCCYYIDKICYDDSEGFCWNCSGDKIAIV